MDYRRKDGFAHIVLFLSLSVLFVGSIAVYLLLSRGLISNPFTSGQKATVALQTQYQNPFDKGTQYANPFSQYKNPFDTAK